MSIRKSILASYLSQLFVAFIGILILPIYLKLMGAEAYGLVGLFAMLQSWFNLLDMGLTPTIARETARHRAGMSSELEYRSLVRALHVVFFIGALAGGVFLISIAGRIAMEWLNVKTLSIVQVELALQLIGASVAIRWMCGLYRGCISGSEQLVWLSGFNAGIAALRFAGALPVLILVGASPIDFFAFQLFVATTELLILAKRAHSLLPKLPAEQKMNWRVSSLVQSLKPVFRLAAAIAFTSSVWVLITQTDKLVLSRILSLADYGYFTLAVLVSSSILLVGGPVSSVVSPRMARLQAQGEFETLMGLYFSSTKLVAAIALPACLLLAIFPHKILAIWTGDDQVASAVAPILRIYSLGNGLLAIAAFPYYLQLAKGNLRLHLIGNLIFLIALVPAVIFFTVRSGSLGAAYVWLSVNLIYFLVWVPIIHNKFAHGLHLTWLKTVVFPPLLLSAVTLFFLNAVLPWQDNRIYDFMLLSICAIALIVSITWSYRRSYFMKPRADLSVRAYERE